jgi:hypothetical protein
MHAPGRIVPRNMHPLDEKESDIYLPCISQVDQIYGMNFIKVYVL